MPNQLNKPKRRLKTKYRTSDVATYKLKIRRLERRLLELKEKHSGGFISPDGIYCDTKYAARYLGKSESTLRNTRANGAGPLAFSKSGSVFYLVSGLKEYIEKGKGERNK